MALEEKVQTARKKTVEPNQSLYQRFSENMQEMIQTYARAEYWNYVPIDPVTTGIHSEDYYSKDV